ncbi:MAG: hypothetical protein R6V85_05975 [Polyangia bacterium]
MVNRRRGGMPVLFATLSLALPAGCIHDTDEASDDPHSLGVDVLDLESAPWFEEDGGIDPFDTDQDTSYGYWCELLIECYCEDYGSSWEYEECVESMSEQVSEMTEDSCRQQIEEYFPGCVYGEV